MVKHIAITLVVLLASSQRRFAFGFAQRGVTNQIHRSYSNLRSRRFAGVNKLMEAAFSNTESASEHGKRVVRILCLHGKGGNGRQFIVRSLEPLRSRLNNRLLQMNIEHISFEWDAITAPFEIPSTKSIDDEKKGFSWWSMPAGVRSFNAKEYEGFSQSENIVMNKLYSNGKCNYDIVFGHSQGAILTAALLSIHSKLWTGTNAPKGFIFNGVAWPNPYKSNMQALSTIVPQEQTNKSNLPQVLFIMGKLDDINPIESAQRVSGAFENAGLPISIIEHDGGHSVPYKSDDDSLRALDEVVDWIMTIIKQK